MPRIYKVGIVGAGIIGNRLALSFLKHPRIEIKYICDLNIDSAIALAEKAKAKPTDKYEELLSDDELDIVYVGVPPNFHADLSIKAMNKGKHVICEKPIARNSEEISEMIKSRDNNNRITAINLPFGSDSNFDVISEIIDTGKYGTVRSVDFKIRMPQWPRSWQPAEWLKSRDQGGPIREIGTHYFYILQELFGEVKNIDSVTKFEVEGCEHTSNALIEFSNFVCNFSLLTESVEEEENTLIIYLEKAVLYHKKWSQLSILTSDGIENLSRESNAEYTLIEKFVNALDGHMDAKNNLVSFEAAGRAHNVVISLLDE